MAAAQISFREAVSLHHRVYAEICAIRLRRSRNHFLCIIPSAYIRLRIVFRASSQSCSQRCMAHTRCCKTKAMIPSSTPILHHVPLYTVIRPIVYWAQNDRPLLFKPSLQHFRLTETCIRPRILLQVSLLKSAPRYSPHGLASLTSFSKKT